MISKFWSIYGIVLNYILLFALPYFSQEILNITSNISACY